MKYAPQVGVALSVIALVLALFAYNGSTTRTVVPTPTPTSSDAAVKTLLTYLSNQCAANHYGKFVRASGAIAYHFDTIICEHGVLHSGWK